MLNNKIEIALIIFTVAAALAVFIVADLVVALNFLIACFVAVAVFMLYIGLDYFALIIIIIYVGAIAVLFLFIIMMIEQRGYKAPLVKTVKYSLLGMLIISYFIYTVVFAHFRHEHEMLCNAGLNQNIMSSYLTHIKLYYALGFHLYAAFGIIFILNSIMLLVGMLGAILLTLSSMTSLRKQEDYEQILKKSGHQRFIGKNRKNDKDL